MTMHHQVFNRTELARFDQYLRGNTDLANVVQIPGNPQPLLPARVEMSKTNFRDGISV
jgi:hypothetical protein